MERKVIGVEKNYIKLCKLKSWIEIHENKIIMS